jgi:hypothetical protein
VIRLIALDLDGTLLTSASATPPLALSPRTLAVLTEASERGIVVVPASGRQPFSIARALAGTFLAEGVVLGANGAIGVHLGTGEVYFEQLLAPDAQGALYHGLRQEFPGVRCVSVRDGGVAFFPQHGYVGMMDPGDHGRLDAHLPEYDLNEVLAEPSLKFIVRDPGVPEAVLLDAARALDVPGCTCLTSGAPFVEVSAGGIHKGSGVASLCGVLGIDRADVVAFGDELNDVEMIAWAGLGVAMGNAADVAKDAADEICPTNDQDGVAVVLERLLGC